MGPSWGGNHFNCDRLFGHGHWRWDCGLASTYGHRQRTDHVQLGHIFEAGVCRFPSIQNLLEPHTIPFDETPVASVPLVWMVLRRAPLNWKPAQHLFSRCCFLCSLLLVLSLLVPGVDWPLSQSSPHHKEDKCRRHQFIDVC